MVLRKCQISICDILTGAASNAFCSELVSSEALLRASRSKVEFPHPEDHRGTRGAIKYMPKCLFSSSRRRRVFPIPGVLKRIEVDPFDTSTNMATYPMVCHWAQEKIFAKMLEKTLLQYPSIFC